MSDVTCSIELLLILVLFYLLTRTNTPENEFVKERSIHETMTERGVGL